MDTSGNSRAITTNQPDIHEKLEALVAKYKTATNLRPISLHTQQAFDELKIWLGDFDGQLVIDSCCGVGDSTARLAALYPDARVIGIDKSALRVDKHSHYAAGHNNYCVIRADVNDMWRLLAASEWTVRAHYLLYPNPYPKSSQVQKRWHASAAMPALMALTHNIEVRSNWKLYLQEFSLAAEQYGVSGCLQSLSSQSPGFTPFERKYQASGQECWQLTLGDLCQSVQ